ncbi:MAG: hypothetical protein J0L81_02705 [Caulobacterales bacterium]|nr:hypothetical protein [Caulobacterales bacterium]
MSGGVILVLHGHADAVYAANLARALAPLSAVAVRIDDPSAGPIHLGAGATCMVVWTPRFASECDLPALLGTLQDSFSIVCAYRCQVADALRYRVRDIVDICGIPATDAQNLRDLLGAQAERPMRMPAQIAAASIAAAPARGNAMLARSALSLTATLAIAGAVSPIVIERAAATSRVDATSSSQELLTNAPAQAAEAETADVAVFDESDDLLSSALSRDLLARSQATAFAPADAPVLRQASFERAPFRNYAAEAMALVEAEAPGQLSMLQPLDAVRAELGPRKERQLEQASISLNARDAKTDV